MASLLRLGRRLFGVGIAAFGILSLLYRDAVSGLEPIPAGAPGQLCLAILSGLILTIAGVSLVTGWQARRGAGLLTVTLGIWLVMLHLPVFLRRPADPNVLTTVSETLALFGAACVVWSACMRGRRRGNLAMVGRIGFGLPMLVFGILHLIYHEFVGMLMPAWIPGRVLWAYATGIAFLAAGSSITFRVRARLAAVLLGVMFGAWVLIVHAPRVVANPGSQDEWTSLFIALAMCGAAWLVGDHLAAEEAVQRGEPWRATQLGTGS